MTRKEQSSSKSLGLVQTVQVWLALMQCIAHALWMSALAPQRMRTVAVVTQPQLALRGECRAKGDFSRLWTEFEAGFFFLLLFESYCKVTAFSHINLKTTLDSIGGSVGEMVCWECGRLA